MRIYDFVLTSTFILSSIECSSHPVINSDIGRNPGPSSSAPAGIQYNPDQNTTDDPSSRARSRSPASSSSSLRLLGHPLRELGYIRLVPRSNHNLQFEFRNYVFPAGQPIIWRGDGKRFSPVPAEEHIVLSASDGEFFAILTYSGVLFGIYRRQKGHPRVKLNMMSGAIDDMTPDEIRDCPVGRNYPVFPQSYIKAFLNHDSLQLKWFHPAERNQGFPPYVIQHLPKPSPTSEESLIRERSMSPPFRPPSNGVLGYTMQQLGYNRLIPCKNHNQRFEFRRFIFPADEPIRMRIDNMSYSLARTTQYIVLSSSNGDVYAILDRRGTLYGIYRADKTHLRVKINMISGVVSDITPEERSDCPVGKSSSISSKNFIMVVEDFNSLQVNYNSDTGRDPAPSSPARQQSPDRTRAQEPALDARSRSPPGRPPRDEVLGYPLSQLGYIRLIPRMNPQRTFEFRRYVLTANQNIRMMTETKKYVLVPTREHIVLSTSSGDVFAILEYTGILRGIYKGKRNYSRIVINMMSGEVDDMTSSEMKECHVGKAYPIFPRWFNKVVSNQDSLQHVYQ